MSLALHSEKMWHAFWKMHWECHFSNSYQLTLKLLNQPGTNLNRFLIFIMFFNHQSQKEVQFQGDGLLFNKFPNINNYSKILHTSYSHLLKCSPTPTLLSCGVTLRFL